MNKKAFTLLEIIIVIIIIGVLTSLALPRLFAMVQYSYGAEAFSELSVLRSAFERCYLMYGEYKCSFNTIPALDVPDPSSWTEGHFVYDMGFLDSGTGYILRARRNAVDGGDTDSYIWIRLYDGVLTKCGTGIFEPIGPVSNCVAP